MAVWFAQSGSCNIDAVGLWNSLAAGGGDTLTWANLGASDVLCANGQSDIAINCDFTCGRLSTAAEIGAGEGNVGAAGGGFTFTGTNSRVVTADVIAGTTMCITCDHTGCTLTIEGDVTGGSEEYAAAIYNTSTGGVAVTGAVIGGSADTCAGIYNESTGPINITGNVTGGSGTFASGVYNYSAAVVTIVGDVAAGSGTAHGITLAGGTLNITGDVVGGTATPNTAGILQTGTGTINVIGNVTGGDCEDAVGINNGDGTTNVTGNVTGGSEVHSDGITNTSGTVTVTGNVTGGSSPSSYTPTHSNPHAQYQPARGIAANGAGTITVTGNVTGGANNDRAYGVESNGATYICNIIGNLIFSNATAVPVSGKGIRYQPAATNYIQIPYDGSTATKCPPVLGAANIKKGVVSGDVTGTYRGYGGVVAPPGRF